MNWVTRQVTDETKLRLHTITNKVTRITTVEANQFTVTWIKDLLRRNRRDRTTRTTHT
jgi:hypothetical protein